MARSPRKRNQIEEALASLRRGSPIVEGIRSIPARPTLSEALAQPIYDRLSNVPEVTAGQRTAKRTLGERFTQNREDALQRGIAAALQRSVDAPGFDPATERNRREAYDLLSANDPFYGDPNPALAAVATGAGQLVGAMQDPTSYIAPGRTILGRAVGGAGVGGATDVIAQALDIGSGVADQYNPLQTAGATVAPALLSLGGDALARAGRRAPEAVAPEPIAPEPLAPVQPRRRGPSVFDYAAYEAANPMPRPFETAPNLPPPRTYEEAVDQVQSLQAQLNEAYRDVGRSTSVQNPGVSGLRSLDRRAVLERQLAAAKAELERLRPPAPERQNAPGTSEAARAYLERLGMGRVAELGSTRLGEPQRPLPDQTARTPRPRAERQVIDATAPSRSLLTPEARTTTQIIRNPSQADLLRLSKNGEELRYFKDPDGNVFVGRAFDLTHYDMLQTTGQPNATQSGLEVGVLARDNENRFSVIVGSGNTPEDQLVSFPMTREWLRGIENTTPTAPEPLAPVTAARPGEPQAMRRGQRPPGDIRAQTQALLDAMEQQANDANLQPSGGNATFQIGERRAPGTWPDRQRPRAPEPLGPVQAQQARRGPGGVSSFGAFELERMLTGKKGPEAVRDAARVGYAGQAPGEAVEYLAAAAKGLPMDNASRMQRARAMGFDTENPVFHGTRSPEQFKKFQPSLRGRFGPGVYFSENPSVAERYGRTERYLIPRESDLLNAMPQLDALTDDVERRVIAQLRPEEAKRLKALKEWYKREGEAFWEALRRSTDGEYRDQSDARAVEVLQAAGFKGIRGIGDGQETLIFDPANIRSIHAAFDPDAADSSNLLAGIGALAAPTAGLGAAGAMAAGAMQEPERRID